MPNSKQVTPDTVEEERDSSRPSNSNNNAEHDAGNVLVAQTFLSSPNRETRRKLFK